jgi:preprotein translocase subunit SecA
MLQKFVKTFGGDPNRREIEKTTDVVEQINALEPEFEALSDEDLRLKTDEFRQRISTELEGIEDEKERQEIEKAVLEEMFSSSAGSSCTRARSPRCAPAKARPWWQRSRCT